jgi:hypothetical protein
MMTKEQCDYVSNFIKINKIFSEQNQKMLIELTAMLEELDMNVKGVLGIDLDVVENKVKINYSSFTKEGKRVLDIYTHNGFDIYYDSASWEIAKREIKDVFFDVRKTMREKAQAAAESQPTFWQRVRRWFSI